MKLHFVKVNRMPHFKQWILCLLQVLYGLHSPKRDDSDDHSVEIEISLKWFKSG